MEYYAAIKKDEFMPFVGTWMKLETIIFSKLTRTENQTPHALTHRWVLNNENTWAEGGEHHTWGLLRGGRLEEEQWEMRRLGRDNIGRNA